MFMLNFIIDGAVLNSKKKMFVAQNISVHLTNIAFNSLHL